MRRALCAAVALLVGVAATASAASFNANLNQTASIWLNATPSGCENNPGPYITLNGEMRLSGINARLILSNNAKGTHTASADVSADMVLIPAGESITIAKQPSRGGVGGNPWIYFQFTDGKGSKLGQPMLLGRCVQGLTGVSGNFAIPTGAMGTVTGGGCSNSGGPYITMSGELRMGGLGGQIILTNNAKFTHATSADVVVDIVLLQDGQTLTFAKQPPLGGAGGNPHIYLQFTSGSGAPLGNAIYLGRCVQL